MTSTKLVTRSTHADKLRHKSGLAKAKFVHKQEHLAQAAFFRAQADSIDEWIKEARGAASVFDITDAEAEKAKLIIAAIENEECKCVTEP